MAPLIRALERFWPSLLTISLLVALALAFYLPNVGTLLDYEDGAWVRDEFPLYRVRFAQRFVMGVLLPQLLGHRIEGYYLAYAGLHLVCAVLIYFCLIQFLRAYRTRVSGCPWLLHLAGSVGGMIFLSYGAKNLYYLSALSYQLMTLSALLALLALLRFFRTARLRYWLLTVLAVICAVGCHSYGYGLPLLVAAMELVWRRNRAVLARPLRTAWRYALLLAAPSCLLAYTWRGLSENRLAPGRLVRHLSDAELLQATALHFVNYLEVLLADLLSSGRGALYPLGLSYPEAALRWSPDRLLTAAALLLLVGMAARTLKGRRTIGVGVAALIFIVAWNGITLHQTLFIGYSEMSNWRYYFNMAGLSMFLAFVLAWGVALPLLQLRTAARGAVVTAIIVTAAAGSVAADAGARKTVSEFLAGEAQLRTQYSWQPSAQCRELTRLEQEEVVARALRGDSLACTDLSHLDLRRRKLSKVDLRGANLTCADLRQADLRGARLGQASLTFANLKGAQLGGADLREANLTGASVQNADLTGARVERSIWVGAFWFSIRWDGLADGEVQRYISERAWKPQPGEGAHGGR